MKALLNLIKAQLKADLSYIKLIEIIPHEFLISLDAGFPLIGILDSGDKEDRSKHQGIQKLTVTIGVYQRILFNRETSVMGKGSSKGVLEIKDNTQDSLMKNLFPGYNLIKYLGSSATRTFSGDKNYKEFIAMKLCKFEYHKVKINY